ncbi:hypothetical protein [Streptomyces scabiei]|uniref:hypothetical protein n=3 Tax=Streptomyces scabiei TaxID=1930 RepID=UPI0004E7BEA3|nr:hypothetical protein [Streptomyces scabiei]MBP5927290.1 hypothetical protein [Streptomyces sp. LBUM 1479]KFG06217.1 hypothetical protein IQ61_26055 [Streptomyces scabiei]MDX2540169.1 hypothetical protein [Streptomyces scabiei]MDX2802585.1 hypothetical protein [Streptomyces scabiei]MDX2835864.1 hypothetical protein [Streptomyces scabiei]
MRAIRVASAALLGAAALSLTAPAAHAARAGDITSFGFDVAPSTVAPGGQVLLRVDGCHHRTTVSSGAFDAVVIPRGHSSATATVDRDARPGTVYEVLFQCGDESGRTDLTISSGHPTHHPTHYPTRGSHAGEGGTVAGFDAHEIGLGAALVAGALGVAWHRARRRPEEGGHS